MAGPDTPGLGGGEVAAAFQSPGAQTQRASIGINAVAGTPQAYAGVALGISNLVGPTVAALTVGVGELGRADFVLPLTNHFPYLNGFEVGGGVVAAISPVQVSLSISGPEASTCF